MSIFLKKSIIKAMMATLLLASLAGCGEGSSNDSDTTGSTVSGSAMAPPASVALFEQKSTLLAIADVLISSAAAEITGLEPITGATVELIQVDNNGIQVGDVLASTTTSLTGNYQLSLPAGIDFAANLVLRITAPGDNSTMQAQVITETVNIDPYSDFLLDKLVENGTRLDTLAINEVLLLKGKLEEFDFTAQPGTNLEQMLAELEAATGEFMDESIETVNNGEGDSGSIAGNYHLGEFGLSLHDHDEGLVGTFSAEVTLGNAELSAGDGSAFSAAVNLAEVDSWYNLVYLGNGTANLSFTDIIEETEEVDGFVDGNGALVIESPFEEDLDTESGFGWRCPPTVTRLDALGSDVFLSRSTDACVRYRLTEEGALDPNAREGDEVFYDFVMLARASENANAGLLNGEYGVVGLLAGAQHGSGVTLIESFYGVEQFDGVSSVNENEFDGIALVRSPDSAAVAETDMLTENFSYAVDSTGKLSVSDNESTEKGFITSDGNLLALFFRDKEEDAGDPPTVTNAESGMVLGLKLPVSRPDMNGRSYRLYNLTFGYGQTDSFMNSLADAVLTFDDVLAELTFDQERGIEKSHDLANIESVSDIFAGKEVGADAPYMLEANGKLNIGLSSAGFESWLEFDGFVSANGEFLVLRSYYGNDPDNEVGIFIGSLIQ